MKRVFKTLGLLGLVGVSALSLASCGSNADDDIDLITVKVGVCGSSNDHWKAVQKVLDDQDSGIILDLVEFAAYNLPNEALNRGDIDLNSFQHTAYLNKEIASENYNITAIGDTLIAPLSIYSKKNKSLEELKTSTNKKIGIPSDATNGGRALKVLEAAGLISVDESKGFTPETKDITANPYNFEITPTSADTLTDVLPDFAACLINGTYAIPYGLTPSKDALYTETQQEGSTNPYVNIIVSRTEDKNNPTYKTIVNAFHTQYVAEFILAAYNEAFFPSFNYSNDFQYFTEETKTTFVDTVKSYTSKYSK